MIETKPDTQPLDYETPSPQSPLSYDAVLRRVAAGFAAAAATVISLPGLVYGIGGTIGLFMTRNRIYSEDIMFVVATTGIGVVSAYVAIRGWRFALHG